MSLQEDYNKYLDDQLRRLIPCETIIRNAIKTFRASKVTKDTHIEEKMMGSLLAASINCVSVRQSFIECGITEAEILKRFSLKKPVKNWKNRTCSTVYVNFFKGVLDDIETTTVSKITPETIVVEAIRLNDVYKERNEDSYEPTELDDKLSIVKQKLDFHTQNDAGLGGQKVFEKREI